MFKNSRVLRLGLMVAMLATALVAPSVVSATSHVDDTPNHTEAQVNGPGGTNNPAYWEAYFEAEYPAMGQFTCQKFGEDDDPVVLAEDHDGLIIKAATTNYVFDPAPAGSYSPPQNSTSHYILCDAADAEAPVINPAGEIEGPCADPAYYARFDNSGSTVDILFRFSWYNRVNGALSLNNVYKTVDAGGVFLTRQKWVSNFTWMRISYKDPNTGEWILLDRELSAKGTYPACDYTPGYQTQPTS